MFEMISFVEEWKIRNPLCEGLPSWWILLVRGLRSPRIWSGIYTADEGNQTRFSFSFDWKEELLDTSSFQRSWNRTWRWRVSIMSRYKLTLCSLALEFQGVILVVPDTRMIGVSQSREVVWIYRISDFSTRNGRFFPSFWTVSNMWPVTWAEGLVSVTQSGWGNHNSLLIDEKETLTWNDAAISMRSKIYLHHHYLLIPFSIG